MIPKYPTVQYIEQTINNVIALKKYIKSIPAVHEALVESSSEILRGIFDVGRTEDCVTATDQDSSSQHPQCLEM